MFLIRTFKSAYFPIQYKELLLVWTLVFLIYCVILKKEKREDKHWLTKKKIVVGVVFALYFAFVLGGALINRTPGVGFEVKLVPFWSYYEAVIKKNWSTGIQILYNILVFVPWGLLLPITFGSGKNRKLVLVSAAIFALVLEVLQFVFRCGTCEFDDIFNNVLGALLGYSIWKLCSARRKRENIVC